MRLDDSWFERYNELRLECRAILGETVANFQRKLNVQVIDFHRRTSPSLTVVKGRGSTNVKQSINNGRTYNTGIHVHRTNNGFSDDYYRPGGRNSIGGSLSEIVQGTTRGSASLTILNPADEPTADHDYHLNQQHNQLTYQRSPAANNNQQQQQQNHQQQRNGRQQRPTSTVKRKRKRPTNVNLFNQLDYDLYSDGHSSVSSSDDSENAIEANSLAANHCDSSQFVPTTLLLANLVLVFTLYLRVVAI